MDISTTTMIFGIIVLIISVVLHEMAHAYTAHWLGDPTPEMTNRLTANPFRHLEWIGSFFVPLFTSLIGGFFIGWAKPVLYNPYNFRKFVKYGEVMVALAGPASNIALASIAALVYHTLLPTGSPLLVLMQVVVFVNVALFVLNMLPIPPLDGSKVVYFLLGRHAEGYRRVFETYGFFIVIGLLFIFGGLLLYPIFWITSLLL